MPEKNRLILTCSIFSLIILSSCKPLSILEELLVEDRPHLTYNNEGVQLMDAGKYEEALDYFYKAINYIDENNLNLNEKDALYHNLGTSYYELGLYDLSLEYMDKALSIEPNDAVEFIIKGNALYSLNRYDEALTYYHKAIEKSKDSDSASAYYGKGLIYFEMDNYGEALEAFNTYLRHERDDIDALYYKVYSLLYLDKLDQALVVADNYLKRNNSYEAYELKGTVLEWSGTYDEIKFYYEQAAEKFPNNLDPQIKIGGVDYYYGFYDESLLYFMNLVEQYPENTDLYIWVIYNYSALGQLDDAIVYYDKALDVAEITDSLHYAIAEAFVDHTLYIEAIKYFNKAIELNPFDEAAYINSMYASFYGKRYSQTIAMGKNYKDIFPYSSSFPWLIGESYYAQGEFSKAREYYKKALLISPNDEVILNDIAFTYFALGEDEMVKSHIDTALKKNPENEGALYLQQLLAERQSPLNERVRNFFFDHYLYGNHSSDFEKDLSVFLGSNMSNSDISLAVESIRFTDDPFTFVLYDDAYDYFMEQEHHDVEFEENDNLVYLKLVDFTSKTSNRVVELLDDVQHKDQKVLVIDLRDNFGGQTTSANDIVDLFISDRVTSTLIDRDGHTFSYYSNASHVTFKQVYIFTNENTASAAELLTLALKTYLNNVTIVGDKTYGKGVGQLVFEDNNERIMVFVTNHYWNVRQTNVSESSITPDVHLKSNDINDYMNVVYQMED